MQWLAMLCLIPAIAASAAARADCLARDFMALALAPGGDPVEIALESAYPGSDLDLAAGQFVTPGGAVVAFGPARQVSDAARLQSATIGDMFAQTYPLDFDLNGRLTPWADPGRARNDALFRALYGDSAAEVRAALVTVRYASDRVRAEFAVTTRHCVAAQLAAALAAAAALEPAPDAWFRDIGGSFNWRVIAGTDRLSSHSFGAAIDLNADLGGYWRWAGATEGAVGAFATTIPPDLVAVMERFGFVWGGKWHHYDGMHFEYRPELILYSRLVAD